MAEEDKATVGGQSLAAQVGASAIGLHLRQLPAVGWVEEVFEGELQTEALGLAIVLQLEGPADQARAPIETLQATEERPPAKWL